MPVSHTTHSWSATQIRVHLDRLIELEYALVHRGNRGQSFEYEPLYDGHGKDGRPFPRGLLDVTKLFETTQIYTQVSIRKLKEIHAATHPGAWLERPATKGENDQPAGDAAALLSSLAAEAAEEEA